MECSNFDIGCYFNYAIEEIKSLFLYFAELILSSFAYLIENIPVPDFLLNTSNFNLPSDLLFYTTLFQLPAGIAIVVSAYTARFILRRIPLIG